MLRRVLSAFAPAVIALMLPLPRLPVPPPASPPAVPVQTPSTRTVPARTPPIRTAPAQTIPTRIAPGPQPNGAALLPNGSKLTPAGRILVLPGDLPLRLTTTPDGRFLIASTGGFHDHSVSLVDLSRGTVTQSLAVGKDWAGLCLAPDSDAVYVSGGGAPGNPSPQTDLSQSPLLRLGLRAGRLTAPVGQEVAGLDRNEQFVSGLAMDRQGTLFAVNFRNDSLYKLGGRPLTTQAFAATGHAPAAVAVSPDGSVVAVSNEGDASVSLFRADTLDLIGRVRVGLHPNDLAFSPDGRLFVVCAGSSSINVIRNGRLAEAFPTFFESSSAIGSTPDALALAPDGTRLYVANAGNNCVAVVDVSNPVGSRVLGLIPTLWRPTALAVSRDGKQLYIGTAKGGLSSSTSSQQVGERLTGQIAIVDVPDAATLAHDTQMTGANIPVPPTTFTGRAAHAVDEAFSAFRHITHVLYIVRDGHTYDQVLGDVQAGNGDPRRAVFGTAVTPNVHAFVRRFPLLDNVYCVGDFSEDGHAWSDAAYATEFVEKTAPGRASGHPMPPGDERLTLSPAGFLWDACARQGISCFSYGEAGTSLPVSRRSARWDAVPAGRHDTERVAVFLADLKRAEKTGLWPQFTVMSLTEGRTGRLAAGTGSPITPVAINDQALGQVVQAVSHSQFWKNTAIFVIEASPGSGSDHVDPHRTVGLVLSPYARHGATDSTFYTTLSFVRTLELILKLPPLTQFDQTATPLYTAFTVTPDFTPYTLRPAHAGQKNLHPTSPHPR